MRKFDPAAPAAPAAAGIFFFLAFTHISAYML
jgi:hypothetical protein